MAYLSLAIWLPMLTGLILLALPKSVDKGAKAFSIVVSLFTFGVLAGVAKQFDSTSFRFQFTETHDWVPLLGIGYRLGIDGIALGMVVLSGFLGLVSILISNPKENAKAFFGLLLILESTLIGVFSSLDLVLFYIFFELSLVPVALLILGWGTGERAKAALKYLGVLFAGSLLMLVGIVALGFLYQRATGILSFSLVDIQSLVASGELWKETPALQGYLFWAFMLAFLVKSPAIPFHTWLADTYESAPIGAIVSGVVLKVGTFGLFRFCLPLFPEAAKDNAMWIVLIGTAGIIYGGIVAINQTNIHRLMAFSTISHVGFILIGLFSLNHNGMMGAAFQQVNHGLASAAVFVLLAFLYRRQPTQNLSELGGLKKSMPIFATLFLIAMLANLGLPLTSGFVGEFLALMGTFQAGFAKSNGMGIGFAAFAGIGAILSAAYMLYMFQRMFYGKAKSESNHADLNSSELAIGGVFAALILVGGIFPTPALKSMDQSVLGTQMMTQPGSEMTWKSDVPATLESGGRSAWYKTTTKETQINLYPQVTSAPVAQEATELEGH